MRKLNYIVLLLIAISCKQNYLDYNSIPLYSDTNCIQAVVEIPAGTNHKIEFDKKELKFKVDKRNGKDRVIEFLPYLGNYGFIPSTYSDVEKGGDGDALDVLILSESLKTGAIIEIKPIGVLKLIDNNELDYKIIAIPLNKDLQIITANNYMEFSNNYPQIKKMIVTWFLNYDKNDIAEIDGWGNEIDAIIDIKKWAIDK